MNSFYEQLHGEAPPPLKKPRAVPKPKLVPDYTEQRAIYAAYLEKVKELAVHQEYALAVAKATHGAGMTPVKPLATMGCNGGPLLCDHCGKPQLLESGKYYNVYADVAWNSNPARDDKWLSYIKGGLMVVIVENGTLRIYHGYDGCPTHCYAHGKAELALRELSFKKDTTQFKKLWEFFESENLVDWQRLANDVYNMMFGFDPGYGVNKPC